MKNKFRNKRLKDMTYDELLEYEEYLKSKGCDPGPKGEIGCQIGIKEKISKKVKYILNKSWR